MGFPLAPGQVDLSSTGSVGYIPDVWAPEFAIKFYPNTFLSSITNTNYQGTLAKQGDVVKIRVKPVVRGRKYIKGMDIRTHNSLDVSASDYVSLKVERGWMWRVPVNKIDEKQSDMDYLSTIITEGTLDSKFAIEEEYLAEAYTAAASYNHGATAGMKSSKYNLGVTGAPIAIDQTNALTYLMMLQAVATEARMPADSGRFAVIPSWFAYMLGISDLKNASFTGLGNSTIISGKIPDVMAGFQLFVTDLYTAITDGALSAVPILFGHKSANTFATQLSVLETVPTGSDFGNTVQALTVYDWKCVNAAGLGYGYAYMNA